MYGAILSRSVWRAWPFLKYFWLTLVGGVLVGLLFDPIRAQVWEFVLSSNWFPLFAGVLVLLVVLAVVAKRSAIQRTRSQLLAAEFNLVVGTESLTPEDLDFTTGDAAGSAELLNRPYNVAYVPRSASETTSVDGRTARTFDEKELGKLLLDGESLLLIGPPTEGKSRLLFELLRSLAGVTIVRPNRNSQPSHAAIDALAAPRVVLLLDDLNVYVGGTADILRLRRTIRDRGWICGIAAACRNEPELGVIAGDYTSPLSRLYESFSFKLGLNPLSQEELLRLWKTIHPNSPIPDISLYPTPGSICMENAYRIMRERFSNALDPIEQACLRSIQLLMFAGMPRLTHARIIGVMRQIMRREPENLSDVLDRLVARGFLKGATDPVTPEAAYLTWDEIRGVVSYTVSRTPVDDLSALRDLFGSERDGEGLYALGGREWKAGRYDAALEVTAVFSDVFKSDSSRQIYGLFGSILMLRAGALRSLGRIAESYKPLEDIVEKYQSRPADLTAKQAISLLVPLSHALYGLKKYEETVRACDELISRLNELGDDDGTDLVVMANYHRAVAQLSLERYSEAETGFRMVINGLANLTDSETAPIKAIAMSGLVDCLSSQGKHSEVLVEVDKVVTAYGDSTKSEIVDLVARAVDRKIRALFRLDRDVEAIDVIGSFLLAHLRSDSETITKVLVRAVMMLGFILKFSNEGSGVNLALDKLIDRLKKVGDEGEKVVEAITKMRAEL